LYKYIKVNKYIKDKYYIMKNDVRIFLVVNM